jgi:hypothetical protein
MLRLVRQRGDGFSWGIKFVAICRGDVLSIHVVSTAAIPSSLLEHVSDNLACGCTLQSTAKSMSTPFKTR